MTLPIEYELSLGDLHVASQLPLAPVLEAFCKHLASTRTYKSFKNDFSRLRAFFGPICQSLEPCPPGVKRGQQSKKAGADKYAAAHVQAAFLEDITPEVVNRFLADRSHVNPGTASSFWLRHVSNTVCDSPNGGSRSLNRASNRTTQQTPKHRGLMTNRKTE